MLDVPFESEVIHYESDDENIHNQKQPSQDISDISSWEPRVECDAFECDSLWDKEGDSTYNRYCR